VLPLAKVLASRGPGKHDPGHRNAARAFAFDALHRPLYRPGHAKPALVPPVPEIIAAIIVIALSTGILGVYGSRLLLGWYLREVRGEKIPQKPGEAIVTYPLA